MFRYGVSHFFTIVSTIFLVSYTLFKEIKLEYKTTYIVFIKLNFKMNKKYVYYVSTLSMFSKRLIQGKGRQSPTHGAHFSSNNRLDLQAP